MLLLKLNFESIKLFFLVLIPNECFLLRVLAQLRLDSYITLRPIEAEQQSFADFNTKGVLLPSQMTAFVLSIMRRPRSESEMQKHHYAAMLHCCIVHIRNECGDHSSWILIMLSIRQSRVLVILGILWQAIHNDKKVLHVYRNMLNFVRFIGNLYTEKQRVLFAPKLLCAI